MTEFLASPPIGVVAALFQIAGGLLAFFYARPPHSKWWLISISAGVVVLPFRIVALVHG